MAARGYVPGAGDAVWRKVRRAKKKAVVSVTRQYVARHQGLADHTLPAYSKK